MTIPPDVIAAAQASQRKYGVPASVTIAQWQLESGSGAHEPGHNGFGLKPRQGMNDPCQSFVTTEFIGGQYQTVRQWFRVFPSRAAAFDAHAALIASALVYRQAMQALPDVGLFISRLAAHYATDPQYAAKLKAMIASEVLAKYDVAEQGKGAAGRA